MVHNAPGRYRNNNMIKLYPNPLLSIMSMNTTHCDKPLLAPLYIEIPQEYLPQRQRGEQKQNKTKQNNNNQMMELDVGHH